MQGPCQQYRAAGCKPAAAALATALAGAGRLCACGSAFASQRPATFEFSDYYGKRKETPGAFSLNRCLTSQSYCGLWNWYDRYRASRKITATAYLDPNLNHTLNSSTNTHGGIGVERSLGAMEQLLKVFYYFANSSESATWASIIRHGDANDIRGIIQKTVDSQKLKHMACHGFHLSHLWSEEVHLLHLDMVVSSVREKYEPAHPPEEWK
ncbi:focal adhesion kinase 1-like [Ursus maritimus]|uniref:Focal adhesion kinase 1-like n=1 Tax=Ursus maritimus TaxID=29073 RepID=A0A8M1FP48_URSMA|nr:focal adhesion kinase 1-like [Ursus maritimus]